MTPTDLAPRPFSFRAQDCPLTLAEGMAEFAGAQPDLLAPDERELAEFVRAHDACHVLFGLGTALDEEALADTWTLLATDMSARRYAAFLRHKELAALFASVGAWQLVTGTLRALPRLVRVLWRTRRMPARWSFWGYGEHLHTPLAALRERFKIRVL
jgi:hypothetical protein